MTEGDFVPNDEQKKVLIFKRGNCIFAFNFNPSESFAGYGFKAPEGEWADVMDSDEAAFDGFSRIKTGEHHFTTGGSLQVYLPSRTALVWKKL